MSFIGSYFEIILVILTIASLIILITDSVLKKKFVEANKGKEDEYKQGWISEYSRSLFPVFLIVLIIRSFLFEPFKIPSGSMLPTLKIGDFIFVNKFSYGVRLPVFWNHKIIKTGEPKRGDVVVFRYPVNPNVNFIKRVVGVPGDHISYINKRLYVNGKELPKKFEGSVYEPDLKGDINQKVEKYSTNINGISHDLYNFPWRPETSFKDIVVPKGEYFMMGDDRDDSEDSRYWGFVPEKNLVGRASMVWWSWDSNKSRPRWGRVGSLINHNKATPVKETNATNATKSIKPVIPVNKLKQKSDVNAK
jgi:signal peptidase I